MNFSDLHQFANNSINFGGGSCGGSIVGWAVEREIVQIKAKKEIGEILMKESS